MRRLEGKIAVVTGASSGIGRAIALAYGREGAKVAVNYNRSARAAEEVAEEIRARSGAALAIQADVSDPQAVDRLLEQVRDEFGRVDVWVNNAGADILTGAGAELPDEQKLARLMEVDFKGTVHWLLGRCASHAATGGRRHCQHGLGPGAPWLPGRQPADVFRRQGRRVGLQQVSGHHPRA